MRPVVFVAPFPLETTLRFARAAARLGGVTLLGVVQEPPKGPDHGVFRELVTVKDAAALPVARHALLTSRAEATACARAVGFPMVLKPPAGMGAKATFRVRGEGELFGALEGMRASAGAPVLAEELLVGEEGSFDTVTIGGAPRVASISHYLPTPLTVLENPWIQWCCVLPRDVRGPAYDAVRAVGVAAIRALGLRDGITHMEWFRRPDGSVVIGEIAQRPPGANITRMIGLAYDVDPYRAWARAVIDGAIDGEWERRHAVGCAFFRGMGRGRVSGVDGVHETHVAIGRLVEEVKLPTLGAPKSDSYEGDGYVIVRHERTEVVQGALQYAIEHVRVRYA